MTDMSRIRREITNMQGARRVQTTLLPITPKDHDGMFSLLLVGKGKRYNCTRPFCRMTTTCYLVAYSFVCKEDCIVKYAGESTVLYTEEVEDVAIPKYHMGIRRRARGFRDQWLTLEHQNKTDLQLGTKDVMYSVLSTNCAGKKTGHFTYIS